MLVLEVFILEGATIDTLTSSTITCMHVHIMFMDRLIVIKQAIQQYYSNTSSS